MIHLRMLLKTSDQNLGPQVNKNNALFTFYEETHNSQIQATATPMYE